MELPWLDCTPETIKADLREKLTARGVDIQLREGSYTDMLLSEAAFALYCYYQQLYWFLAAAFPDADSGPLLDMAARELGMVRKDGTTATVTVEFTGDNGIPIPAGTVIYAESYGLRFVTMLDAVIAEGKASVPAEAAEIGADYNVPAGAIDALGVTVPGVKGVTNPEPAKGGSDEESDEDLDRRYHAKLQRPATSGNPAQYIEWALEVEGVAYAACVPLWAGNGTVLLIIAGPDRGALDEAVRKRCADYVEERKTIGATVTVRSVTPKTIALSATVTLAKNATTEGVTRQLTERVGELLQERGFGEQTTIPYARFLGCLLSCSGVVDYSKFTVNGKTAAVELSAEDAPELGSVTVTETGGGA